MNLSSHLRSAFKLLLKRFGPQRWWPAETPFEVCIGAILTQNTAWTNVEKAIANLKSAHALHPKVLLSLPDPTLAQLIRPSGYFNLKARRLKAFVRFFVENHGASIKQMAHQDTDILRQQLLGVYGIGKETADSILLYSLDKPIFIIDAYTRRVFERHGWIRGEEDYDTIREMVEAAWHKFSPEQQRKDFNEFHALIVALGKDFCHKKNPVCCKCPLQRMLPKKKD
ncbi:MAG: endonuclease III domain-containing protein [Verrucomicrobiae bacterium]|nr:endonuclease III domain-containing protein [Verrucomicrobiae bacterium]